MTILPWLQEDVSQWQKMILNQRVPHAVLLTGAKGIGKLKLAQIMAQLALCENTTNNGACGKCKACQLYRAGNHTDLSVIVAEKETIKVEQIRKLTRDVTLSSTRNQYKVIIIQEVEKMNSASANALLKTLEEPPKNVVIILTTNEIGRLLATIKSRCVKLTIKIPETSVSRLWLQDLTHNQKQTDIDNALLFSDGQPLTALNLLENKSVYLIQEMLAELTALLENRVNILEISKKWVDGQQLEFLVHVATYYKNLLYQSQGLSMQNGIIDNNDKHSYSNAKFKTKLFFFINEIHKMIKLLKTPLKKELLVENLLINWKS